MANSQSKITLQQILDKVLPLGDVRPVLAEVSGFQLEPFITICTDVMNEIYGQPFPYKWNEIKVPPFYTNSWQQDYALVNPDGTSFYALEWLERGVAINLSSTTVPKQWTYVETARQLPQATGAYINPWFLNPQFEVNSFPNYMLYYGTWGAGNIAGPTQGNNPNPGTTYTDPRGATVTSATWVPTAGGQIVFFLNYVPSGTVVGGSLVVTNAFPAGFNNQFTIVDITDLRVTVTSTTNPGLFEAGGLVGGTATNPAILGMAANPITQVQDPNGNLQVVTTYGVCGNFQPKWPASDAAPGTQTKDGSVIWTVVDPNGIGVRVLPVPSQTGQTWQFLLVGQQPAPNFSADPAAGLSQTLAPYPDKYEPQFRMGVIAQCYKYSSLKAVQDKFEKNHTLWLRSLVHLREKQDRELEENMFTPERGIMGAGTSRNKYIGAAWPFNYPY
jgi:hypothetical protein